MTSSVGHGHLGAPRAGDLVAHAREAVLAVEGVRPLRPPAIVQLAGEAAGRGQRVVAPACWRGRRRRSPARTSAVLRRRGRGRRSCRCKRGSRASRVRRVAPSRPRPASRRRAASSSRRPSRASPPAGSEVLDRVERGGVEPDELHGLVGEHRPRAGGEVLQAGPDGEDDVGLGGQCVGATCSRSTPIGTGVERMGRHQRRLAGDGLDDGDVVALGERRSASSASE